MDSQKLVGRTGADMNCPFCLPQLHKNQQQLVGTGATSACVVQTRAPDSKIVHRG
jgi:hypothetical protein